MRGKNKQILHFLKTHLCILVSVCRFCLKLSVTPTYSKCSELEEELKTVTNTMKSLEAQAEKVSV